MSVLCKQLSMPSTKQKEKRCNFDDLSEHLEHATTELYLDKFLVGE